MEKVTWLPSSWGPNFWRTFHLVTMSFPDPPTMDDAVRYKQYFQSFAHILPCISCRTHFSEMMEQYPAPVKSRNEMMQWGVDMHNRVNYRLQKPMFTVAQMIDSFREKVHSEREQSIWPWLFLLMTSLWFFKHK